MNAAHGADPSESAVKARGERRRASFRNWPFHAMLLLPVLFVFVFSYLPMAGIVMAFQDFKPWLGIAHSQWVGWDNFKFLFERPDGKQIIVNTLVIGLMKWALYLVVPTGFAILLNEVRKMWFKRSVQTLVYLPHFLSWVILGGILLDMLGTDGLVNRFVRDALGMQPLPFLIDGDWFRFTVIASDLWKEFGFATIVYLAALAGINPALYEAAEVDGANRFRQTIYVTVPALIPIVLVLGTLALGNILNAGFDQIFNLYSPLVYDKGDIIDTFVYRVSILQGSSLGFGTAVGVFKSFVGLIMISLSYYITYKYANYRVF